jgi:hypothetical protein
MEAQFRMRTSSKKWLTLGAYLLLAGAHGCDKAAPFSEPTPSFKMSIVPSEFASTRDVERLLAHMGWTSTSCLTLKCDALASGGKSAWLHYQIEFWSGGRLVDGFGTGDSKGVGLPFEGELAFSLQEIKKTPDGCRYKIGYSLIPKKIAGGEGDAWYPDSSVVTIPGPCLWDESEAMTFAKVHNEARVDPLTKSVIWAFIFGHVDTAFTYLPEHADKMISATKGALVFRVWLDTKQF